MNEVIVDIRKSKRKYKKYVALVRDKLTKKIRKIHFGDNRYPQFKDSTPLRLYSSKDHLDLDRRRRYYI